MPTTYMDGSVTTDTILTLDTNYVPLMRCKVFFPGNGVDAYTVLSAFFTQDTHSVAVKVNGATTFFVPALGRWSDYSSIVGFTVPGDIHLLTTCKYVVPIYTNGIGGVVEDILYEFGPGSTNIDLGGTGGTFHIDGIPANFTCTINATISGTNLTGGNYGGEGFSVQLYEDYGRHYGAYVSFGLLYYRYGSNVYLYLLVEDRDGTGLVNELVLITDPSTVISLMMAVYGKSIKIYCNGTEIYSLISTIDAPLLGITEAIVSIADQPPVFIVSTDSFSVQSPVDTTEVFSTETITVTDNSLIQAGDTITIHAGLGPELAPAITEANWDTTLSPLHYLLIKE
jgi:hypothetical protein